MNYYFVGLLTACTLYALAMGGAPERIGASLYALSVVATHILLTSHAARWQDVEYGEFIVDVVVFFAFLLLAVRADRFWPLWVSALLGLGVLGHLAMLGHPRVIPWAYAVVLSIWSYPILLIMAGGTLAHRRRLTRNGADRSWTRSFGLRGRHRPGPGPTH